MSRVRQFAGFVALMAAVSTTAWSVGCGESAGGSGAEKKPAPAPAKAPEAGSSNGAGTSVPAEK